MSNIKLPVSKDINWGPALNSYLSQLAKKVDSIEGQIAASATDNSRFNMANATYVSSGWSSMRSELEGEINNDILTVKADGIAYYGGGNITAQSYTKEVSYSTSLNDNKAYFVYFNHDVNNNTTLEVHSKYKYAYNYILVGFVKKSKGFVPYYQTCTQSQFQAKYDLDHIWGDMDKLYISVSVNEDGAIKVSANGKYVIEGLNKTITLFEEGAKTNIEYSVDNGTLANCIYEATENNEPKFSDTGIYDSESKKDLDRYGRILVDVFGDIYVQYPNIDKDEVKNWQIVNSNQPVYVAINNQLYNLAFYSINDEDLGYRPNMMLEVGRFAIIGGTVNKIYSQGDTSSGGAIYFAKALNAGVMCQQSQNAWVSNTGDVALSELLFRNVNDGYPFKLKYAQNIPTTDYPTFIIDKNKTTQIDNYFMFENHVTPNIISLARNNGTHFQIGNISKGADNELKKCGYTNVILDSGSFAVGDRRYNTVHNIGLRPFNIFIGNSFECVNEILDQSEYANITYNHIGLLKTTSNKTEDEYINIAGTIELFSSHLKAQTQEGCGDSSIDKKDYIIIGSTEGEQSGDKKSIITIHSDEQVKLFAGENKKKESSITVCDENITLKAQNLIKCSNIEMETDANITFLSDRRCKENISALKFNYLDTILKTPVVHYNYLNDSTHQVGIIAQDLEDNLPANQDVFIRKTNSDGLKNRRSIAETKLVYILWKGLQEEVQARKKLEKELEELKNKIK